MAKIYGRIDSTWIYSFPQWPQRRNYPTLSMSNMELFKYIIDVFSKKLVPTKSFIKEVWQRAKYTSGTLSRLSFHSFFSYVCTRETTNLPWNWCQRLHIFVNTQNDSLLKITKILPCVTKSIVGRGFYKDPIYYYKSYPGLFLALFLWRV